VTYAAAGVATPLYRYSYSASAGNVGNVKFTTTANVNSGFGSSASGPTLYVSNNYSAGTVSYPPGSTVLYKTGTANNLEETSIVANASTTSYGYRIVNPDAGTAADNPAYTGTESAFNSQTGAFYSTDATNVAEVFKWDNTNYSSGYIPVGPNLSTRSGAQYFTFRFVGTSVSKFNIVLNTNGGTAGIAGLWVAAPGTSIDTTAAPTNGWINGAVTYAGSGVPGTGTGGNGSAGCAVGGNIPLNTTISGTGYTMTFGTVNTSSSSNHYIYVRVKLTSGQQLSNLYITTATN
jgi:hypothetical protein